MRSHITPGDWPASVREPVNAHEVLLRESMQRSNRRTGARVSTAMVGAYMALTERERAAREERRALVDVGRKVLLSDRSPMKNRERIF